MNTPARRALTLILAALALGCGMNSFAAQEMLSVDTKFRAKIMKEKIRMAAQERQLRGADAAEGKAPDSAHCGSQNIGNVDTGRSGANAPREVFVFAPNAINIVGRGSC